MSVRPNIVVMVSDTFRRDHLGAYWNQYIRTRGTGHIAELYELTEDGVKRRTCGSLAPKGKTLCEGAISFLAEQGTPEDLLAPRCKAVESFVPSR